MTVLNFGLNYHENNGNMVLTYIIRFMEEDFMKKRLLMIIAVVTMIFCCGCGNAIPDLSEEESAMVSEYAAGLLLKYDSEYETKFLNEKELEEQEAIQKKIEEEAARRAEIAAAAEQKNQKEKPCLLRRKSASTIILQSSSKLVLGSQPSNSLALAGLPMSSSTSAGR